MSQTRNNFRSIAAIICLVIVVAGGLFWMEYGRRAILLYYMVFGQSMSSVPIKFYGRVVDQEGKGVPNATLDGRHDGWDLTGHPPGPDGSKWSFAINTDADGNFTLSGIKAQSIDWEHVTCPGYYYSRQHFVFVYSSDVQPVFKPDPARPVVFHMWRIEKPNPHLVNLRGPRFAIPSNGQQGPKSIYLMNPIQVRDGKFDDADLIVEGHRGESPNPNQPPNPGNQFEWSVDIDMRHAGLIETNEPFPYRPPENGYSPHWSVTGKPDDPNSIYSVRKCFYVKDNDGHRYLLLDLTLDRGWIVDCGATYSPDGSRNIEPVLK